MKQSQEENKSDNKGYNKGTQHAFFSVGKKEDETYVWCPKLSFDDYQVKIPYINTITADGKTIYEASQKKNASFVRSITKNQPNQTRFVFAHYLTSSGQMAYVFMGVYKLNLDKTKQLLKEPIEKRKRVWERVSDELDIRPYHTGLLKY